MPDLDADVRAIARILSKGGYSYDGTKALVKQARALAGLKRPKHSRGEVDRLSEEEMPLSGLVVNRVHTSQLRLSADRSLAIAEDLAGGAATVEEVALRRHASLMRVVEREHLLLERFSAARPTVATTRVESLPTDVNDLASLRRVGALLSAQD